MQQPAGAQNPPLNLAWMLSHVASMRCSFTFMKKHESKFEPAWEVLWEEGVQLNSFLRKGCVGEGAIQLSAEQRARFDEEFRLQLAGTGWDLPTAEAPHP